MDDHYIYVADVGDNHATRDTLFIFRIPKSGILAGDSALNHDCIISLSFDEEVVMNDQGYSSHDCEAVLAYMDSLYLFSKDWVTESTSVYVIPVVPGHYHIKRSYMFRSKRKDLCFI